MSDEAAPVESAAPEGSAGEAAGVETGEVASAATGDAPGGGDDARATEGAAGEPSAAEVAKFLFANREFRDQKHAEEVVGGEVNRTRGLQRQNAEQTKELDALRGQLRALQGMVPQQAGNGQKQESGGKPETAASFADQLVKSGDIEYFNKLAANPEIGVGGAIFELAKHLDKHNDERFSRLEEQVQTGNTSLEMRLEQEKALARTFTAAKGLTEEFPELDDGNKSEEALEAQSGVLELLQSTPQVIHPRTGNPVPQGVLWLAERPEQALRWAAGEYRRTHGVPVFGQPPGTSDSPSAKVAAAAEKADVSPDSLDGTGVPRQGRTGGKETLADTWRKDAAQLRGKEATSPSGRKLGFPA